MGRWGGIRARDIEKQNREPWDAEVQVIRLSQDVAVVGLPGEIFVELGLRLKAEAGVAWLAIATQSNTALGYVPDSRAYAQRAYEVVSTRFAMGSGEKMIDVAIRMLGSKD